MSKVILFEDKRNCCGCGACMNVCPKKAITMREDECGFLYPDIDDSLCVNCDACRKVCGYQNLPEAFEPQKVYALAAKDQDILKKSASGGAFALIANSVLQDGGVVYGAALLKERDTLEPKHIRIDNAKDIELLQGSKYVQSDIGMTYLQAKRDVQEGKIVLFSGTPCQIAGLKRFVGKEYDNLLTIEVICHGVPSRKMFQDFIASQEQQLGGKIEQFFFRDKSKGQGMVTRTVWLDRNNKSRQKTKLGGLLSFVYFFSKSYIYRENCYSCPFAKKGRSADLTIGDFWGFHEEHPNSKLNQGLSNGEGVSCVLVNTEKGQEYLETCQKNFTLIESEFSKVAKHNEQLHTPSKCSEQRDVILALYQTKGYTSLDRYFKKHYRIDRLLCAISGLLPKSLKRNIKRILSSIRKRKK